MKKLALLLLLIVAGAIAGYLYIDTSPPAVSWGAKDQDSINAALKVAVTDDKGLKEVCFTLSGGSCAAVSRCASELATQSYELVIDPGQCVADSEPFAIDIVVTATDTSLIANKTEGAITLTFDNQPPRVTALQGTRYLKQGGTGVVLFEVGEEPVRTGIVLNELHFKAFPLGGNTYLSYYVHPYDIKPDDFKPRIFATDAAGNLTKIRPGSSTSSRAYRSETIDLSDNFLESVKDKMMATSPGTPLEDFIQVNDVIRKQNYEKILQECADTQPRRLWEGAFLRNLGATKANFADSRTYQYRGEIVSRQVHTGIDIAGINNTPIVAANRGRVVFTGNIGIYGNVVILDHGYGIHTLYGHLNQIHAHKGDLVDKGQTIAVSGETGLAFGDHLHFEIRVSGVPVDPVEWFDSTWVQTHVANFLPEDPAPQ